MVAAASLRPGGSDFESLLAAVRGRSARHGVERVRRALLERLAVEPRDRVLELGVGSGRLLSAVAARAAQGFVAGVEPEEVAFRHASRRCERLVREGRVALLRGTSRDLSAFEGASFDKVYGVFVSYFWDDPLPHLREVRRVLRPGGRLLLGTSEGEPGPGLERGLVAAGFRELRISAADKLVWTTAE
jgi:ubiquinone/menaquinone biosynthesis C-methylase UbiE